MVLDSAKKWWNGEAEKADGDSSGWNFTEKLSSAASKVRDCSESAATSIGNSAKSAWNSETVNTTATKIKESTYSAANSIKNGAQAAWNSDQAATVKDYSGRVKTKVDEFNAGLMATKEVDGSNRWSWWSDSKKSEAEKNNNLRREVEPTKETGWGMRSVASAVKDASFSVASTIGSSTKAAWNSEIAVSTSSAVKSGISSAGSEVKNWWNSKSEKPEDLSCQKKNQLKMSEKGWGFMSSAASTVKDCTYSAASSIGNSETSAWNSEAAANTTSAIQNTTAAAASLIGNSANAASSAIKNTTKAAASSIGNSATAAWNSEIAASASSAVKNRISSAGNGVKSWWNSESKKTEDVSCEKKNQLKTSEKGWGFLGSTASSVKSYTNSAASSISNSVKSARNSEATSAIKNTTASAASSIGNSATLAVKNGIRSAGSGVKNWWKPTLYLLSLYSVKRWFKPTFYLLSLYSVRSWRKPTFYLLSLYSVKSCWKPTLYILSLYSVKSWCNSESMKTEDFFCEKTVKDYTNSDASSIDNTVKRSWNFDAAANTTSAISNTTASAASSIGNSATSALNAAGFGVKSWWNRESEKTEESSGDSVRGGIAAMAKNSSEYIIKTTGRKSGILKIIDKTNYSPYGKPQWWIRYYRPRVPTPQQHININKAITGINDPHIPISPMTAKTVGALGKVAEKANEYAPILTTAALVYESYRVGKDVKKDYDHGTTRNTIKTVATTTATYTSGSVGACAGASIGSFMAPGLGTIFGGIAGGLVGGYYGGYYGNVASERALDHIQWDHVTLECKACREEYTWKKYQEIEGVCCTPFESRNQDTSRYWFNKLFVNHDF